MNRHVGFFNSDTAMYDSTQITKLYVFGTDNPSSDYNEHIRPRPDSVSNSYDGPPVSPSITFSMSEYMTSGGGRYAYPALFPVVQRFFGTNLEDGVYGYDDISAELGLTDSDFALNISQYGTAYLTSGDHAERAYIFGSTQFFIRESQSLQFVVENGQRKIFGLEVYADEDNFDFITNNGLAGQVNNNVLRPSFDPYRLGRDTVAINYVGEGVTYNDYGRIDYTAGLIAGDDVSVRGSRLQRAQDLAGISSLGLFGTGGPIFATILSDRFLSYSSGNKTTVYGTPEGDNLSPSNAKFIAEDLLNFGYRIVGGSGADAITDSVLGDELLGGDGNDSITAGIGSDVLNGGSGNDTLDGGEAFSFAFDTDTAVYRGPASAYDISTLPNGDIRISDQVAGRDGTDTLRNVERAQFSDRTVNLTSLGQDIAFVVDTTGSMSDDIQAVKSRANEIISAIFDSETGSINSRIAVVGYNDPATTTFLSFTDQPNVADRKTAAISAINRLSASGGGDFPEAVNAGLLRALDGRAGEWREDAAARRIILFGDAPPNDQELREQVLALAANVGVSVPAGAALRASSSTAAVASLAEDITSESLLLPEDVSTAKVAENLAVTRFAMLTTNEDGSSTKIPVEIFTVLIGSDSTTATDFQNLAEATGGEALNARGASDLVDLILSSIEAPIEEPPNDVPNPNEGTLGKDEFQGTENDDTFSSLSGDDKLEGKDGNDLFDGGADDDKINGGNGDDVLIGGDGKDKLEGDDGNDSLDGGRGDDDLKGGKGNDALSGGDGKDKLDGDDGDDLIEGGAGKDDLKGGKGNDILSGGDGADKLKGEDGDDSLDGGAGDDDLDGGKGNNIMFGGDGNDKLDAKDGDDLLSGGLGNDRIKAGKGDDDISGDGGDDELSGEDGNDVLVGGVGDDLLKGGKGEDTLLGDVGNDTLRGEDGDDLLTGGVGDNVLEGGKGSDTFMLSIGAGIDTIKDFTDGVDVIGLSMGISYDQLGITSQGKDTSIQLLETNDTLAILSKVSSDSITEADFQFVI